MLSAGDIQDDLASACSLVGYGDSLALLRSASSAAPRAALGRLAGLQEPRLHLPPPRDSPKVRTAIRMSGPLESRGFARRLKNKCVRSLLTIVMLL